MSRPGWGIVLLAAALSAAVTWMIALAVIGGRESARETKTPPARAGRSVERDPDSPSVTEPRRERAARPAAAPDPEPVPALEAAAAAEFRAAAERAIRARDDVLRRKALSPDQFVAAKANVREHADAYVAALRKNADLAEWESGLVAGASSDPAALETLLAAARDSSLSAAQRRRVLDTLAKVPTAAAAGTAESVLLESRDPAVRNAALRVIQTAVAHGAPVPAVVRSLTTDWSAPVAERDLALLILLRGDPQAGLPLLETLVMSADAAESARGVALLVQQGGGKILLPLMTKAVFLPQPADRRQQLTDLIARTKDKPWSRVQMTGEPDTVGAGDLPTAWAAKSEDMGLVTIELAFARAVRPEAVRIAETFHPGGVASIAARRQDGKWETLWEGRADAEDGPRWFEPPLRSATFTTDAIQIVLDTDRVKGWEEIDAVELVGDGVRQWAQSATATSSYAE